MSDPAVSVLRNRAGALKQQAHDYKSPYSVQLWGEATASRMALGCHVAARELTKIADEMEFGRLLPIHRTEAGYPRCATCEGGGCYDCTDPA